MPGDQTQIPEFARQALYCWSHPWPLSSSLWFASLMSRTFCVFPSEYWLPLRRTGFIGFRKFILRKDQGETNHAIWSIYKKIFLIRLWCQTLENERRVGVLDQTPWPLLWLCPDLGPLCLLSIVLPRLGVSPWRLFFLQSVFAQCTGLSSSR